MSNLSMISPNLFQLGNQNYTKNRKRLAYETYAHRYLHTDSGQYGYLIQHHASIIADIAPGRIAIGNAGWHTRTTADRLNRVLNANGIEYRAVIRQGHMYLVCRDRECCKLSFDNMNYGFVFIQHPMGHWVLENN